MVGPQRFQPRRSAGSAICVHQDHFSGRIALNRRKKPVK
jgi:hypothetical protein